MSREVGVMGVRRLIRTVVQVVAALTMVGVYVVVVTSGRVIP